MFYRMIAVMLVAVLLHGSLIAQTHPQSPVQTPAQMQQVLRRALEKNKAVKITLTKKIDNRNKFTGKVSEVSDTGFTVTDQQTGKTMELAYEDVRQVSQKGLSKGAKIGIAVAIGIAALVVVAVAVTRPWRSE